MFTIPGHLKPEFDHLIEKACSINVDDSQVRVCAWLLIRARCRPESEVANQISRTVKTPNLLMAGALCGFEDGEDNPDRTEKAYKRALEVRRYLRDHVVATLRQLREKMEEYEKDQFVIVREESRLLLRAMSEFVAFLDGQRQNLLDLSRPKSGDELFTDSARALVMWHQYFARSNELNEDTWENMHTLAKVWGVTESVDIFDFKRRVLAVVRRSDLQYNAG